MKLELKHLAGYLPYGLKLHDIYVNTTYKTLMNCEMLDYLINSDNECVKPILKPLSDLTKEIEVNGEKFVPINNLIGYGIIKHSNNHFIELDFYKIVYNDMIKLLEWHFDIYNLIENNLAIDKNTIL